MVQVGWRRRLVEALNTSSCGLDEQGVGNDTTVSDVLDIVIIGEASTPQLRDEISAYIIQNPSLLTEPLVLTVGNQTVTAVQCAAPQITHLGREMVYGGGPPPPPADTAIVPIIIGAAIAAGVLVLILVVLWVCRTDAVAARAARGGVRRGAQIGATRRAESAPFLETPMVPLVPRANWRVVTEQQSVRRVKA